MMSTWLKASQRPTVRLTHIDEGLWGTWLTHTRGLMKEYGARG